MWLQTGKDDSLAIQHTSSPMRHPGDNAVAMSAYVSCQQNNINLQPDSCVCHGCEMDFLRNRNNPITPRWLRLKNEVYTIKHCILCCKLDTCDCQHIQEWGPSEWCDGSIEWWSQYLTKVCVLRSIKT